MSNKSRYLYLMMVSGSLLLGACVADKKRSTYGDYEPAKLRKQTKKESEEEAVRIKTELAIAYMNGGNYRAAMQSIQEALKENDKYDMAWLTRAEIEQFFKQYDKADLSFKQALKLSPNSSEINNNYGWFLCSALNKPNDSIHYFDKALSDPTYPSPEVAYLNKGVCHTKMQQYKLADSYFERALQMNPQFVPVIKERARTQMLAGNIREADRLFRQYQSLVERLSADDLLLGWRLAKMQGQTQPAFEYEAQLRELYPYSNELKSITDGDFNSEFESTSATNDVAEP